MQGGGGVILGLWWWVGVWYNEGSLRGCVVRISLNQTYSKTPTPNPNARGFLPPRAFFVWRVVGGGEKVDFYLARMRIFMI